MYYQIPKPGIIMSTAHLSSLRIEFLRVSALQIHNHVFKLIGIKIVCSHEHFIALNLPLHGDAALQATAIVPSLLHTRFLASLVMFELSQHLKRYYDILCTQA